MIKSIYSLCLISLTICLFAEEKRTDENAPMPQVRFEAFENAVRLYDENPEKLIDALNWKILESSNVTAVAYLNQEKWLVVRFVRERYYVYANVPEALFRTLSENESPGKFMHTEIIPNHPYIRLNEKLSQALEAKLKESISKK